MGTSWRVTGEYMETCSCDFLCPCIARNMTTPATHDFCKVAFAFEIGSGRFGDVSLDGVRFAMFAETQAVMSSGNWKSALVIDASATDEQAEAVRVIATVAGNGPLAMFDPLISDFRGVERHPILFEKQGKRVLARIEGMLDHEVEGIDSLSVEGECIALDNTGHPVNKRLNLAVAVRSVIRAFGIEWQAQPGRANGHFAPFAWSGEAR